MDDDGNIAKYVVLTDIIGAEDHFGDMDFKLCGTRDGVTGFQLDLKIRGLPFDIAKEAVKQVTEARMKILDVMDASQPAHRKELREHAPRIEMVQIDPEKIGALIGPGGKNIRRITEVTGANIDIDEDNSGKVRVYANNSEAMKRALSEIDLVTGEIEAGKTYRGIVRGVKEFGAFVECLPGMEGLCHISELADFRVNRTEDICKLGDEIIVKCIGIDDKGRVKLSRRAALEEKKASEEDDSSSDQPAAETTEATASGESTEAEAPAEESTEAEAPAEESTEDAAPAEESTEEEAPAEEAPAEESTEEEAPAEDSTEEEAPDEESSEEETEERKDS
jgi:polyribonucleotide nucleotidyltransferase